MIHSAALHGVTVGWGGAAGVAPGAELHALLPVRHLLVRHPGLRPPRSLAFLGLCCSLAEMETDTCPSENCCGQRSDRSGGRPPWTTPWGRPLLDPASHPADRAKCLRAGQEGRWARRGLRGPLGAVGAKPASVPQELFVDLLS